MDQVLSTYNGPNKAELEVILRLDWTLLTPAMILKLTQNLRNHPELMKTSEDVTANMKPLTRGSPGFEEEVISLCAKAMVFLFLSVSIPGNVYCEIPTALIAEHR